MKIEIKSKKSELAQSEHTLRLIDIRVKIEDLGHITRFSRSMLYE